MNGNRIMFSPLVAFMILTAVIFGVLMIPDTVEEEPVEKISHKPIIRFSFTIPMPNKEFLHECVENKANAKLVMYRHNEFMETIDSFEIPTCKMVFKSLGDYYITGYTSIECGGSTMTASGATCFKANEDKKMVEPTTCAIDPSVHDFGDIFYLEEFGYYIAEDTGSAVKGKHLDLYFYDSEYNYALSITGKYEVFAVEYVDKTFQAGAYDIRDMVAEQVTGWSIKTIEEGEANG